MRTRFVIPVLAVLATAGCAHQNAEVRDGDDVPRPAAIEVVQVAEAAPPAAAPERPREPVDEMRRLQKFGRRPAPAGDTVQIPTDGPGLKYAELFRLLSGELGITVRYAENNATIKNRKVTTAAPTTVPRADLLAWAQDACFFDGLLLLPFGPADRHEFAALDIADPMAPAYATPVSEDDLPGLSGRVGLYVTCTMTLPDGVDAARARTALSQYSTRIAGLGRVVEIGKTSPYMIVTDFASVAATMRNALDRMAVSQYQRRAGR